MNFIPFEPTEVEKRLTDYDLKEQARSQEGLLSLLHPGVELRWIDRLTGLQVPQPWIFGQETPLTQYAVDNFVLVRPDSFGNNRLLYRFPPTTIFPQDPNFPAFEFQIISSEAEEASSFMGGPGSDFIVISKVMVR